MTHVSIQMPSGLLRILNISPVRIQTERAGGF